MKEADRQIPNANDFFHTYQDKANSPLNSQEHESQ